MLTTWEVTKHPLDIGCQGKRYTEDVLALTYKDKSIYDVLCMTAREELIKYGHSHTGKYPMRHEGL